jgi:ABC-type glycerol-3-phosphate transport system substrate-binding protein
MRKARPLAAILAVVLALAACTGSADETTTTTEGGSGVTTAPAADTTTTTASGVSTTLRGQVVSEYETVARLSTDNGEVLHVVIPQGGYTEIDIFNFIAELKDSNPDIWGVEVFVDAAAAAAFAVDSSQRTEEQAQLLRRHHLASLVSGDTVRYQGPFSDFGQQVLGS